MRTEEEIRRKLEKVKSGEYEKALPKTFWNKALVKVDVEARLSTLEWVLGID